MELTPEFEEAVNALAVASERIQVFVRTGARGPTGVLINPETGNEYWPCGSRNCAFCTPEEKT